MEKTKKITKPKKHTKKCWTYNEVAAYLEQLHGKKFRDYAGKYAEDAPKDDSIPYQDFWQRICELNEIHNGCFIHLPEWEYFMKSEVTEPWMKEIMQYFKDFLGEDYDERMWCEW